MAETEPTTTPPHTGGRSSGGPLGKVESFVGKHKLVVFGGGALAFILLLSQKGKTSTIQGATVAPTDETGVDTGNDTTSGEGDETETPPPDDTTTTDDTPTADAPVELPPPDPGPSAPVAPIAAPPTPAKLAPPTISSDPSQSTPAGGTPTTQAPAPVHYQDVPGYYTELQVIRTSGETQTWHHYTSGTRKGDVVFVSSQGTAWGWPYRSTPAGWTPGGLSYIPSTMYYRVLNTVQYELTHTATTIAP